MASPLDLYPSDADLWLEFGGIYTRPDPPNLHPDGSMEAVGVVDWIAFNAVASKQLGSPHSGTQCLRVAYNGVSADGMAYKAILTSGVRYVVSGWARSGGTAIPCVSDGIAHRWIGTASTDWQYFSVEFVSGGTQFQLRSLNLGAGLYVEFDDIIVQKYVSVIDNLAERGDAPKLVTCGDGITASTIVQQVPDKRGVVFAGTQYINTGIIDRFERTDAFTLFVVAKATAGSAASDFFSSMDAAQGYRGIGIGASATQGITGYVLSVASSSECNKAINPIGLLRSITSLAVTNNGSSTRAGFLVYANGALGKVLGVGKDTLSTTVKNGKPFILGADHNGAGKTLFFNGTMHFAAIFPLAATAIQVQNLTKGVLRRINLP